MQEIYGNEGQLELLTAENYLFTKELTLILQKFSRGKILDAGAGYLSRKKLLNKFSEKYISCDVERFHPDIDYVCDLTGEMPFKEKEFDTIVNISVLEHTKKPILVLKNFHKVLADNGYIVLATPFLFYEHGMPYDYFRFTTNGIKELAEEADLNIVEFIKTGGLICSFLSLFASVFSLTLFMVHLKFLIPYLTKFIAFVCSFEPDFMKRSFYGMTISVLNKKNS